MIKSTLFTIMMATCLVAAYTHAAHACGITNVYGQTFTDSDCDGVQDYTDDVDHNNDGLPDGDRVDNCQSAPNGDCGEDIANCNVNLSVDANKDPTVDKFEMRAGDQADWNRDGVGDACDDADKDTVRDYLDNCKITPNADQDPAACVDTDADGFEDRIDNCPETYNSMQEDTDADGVGDWCDNCRFTPNADQNAAACPKKDDEEINPIITEPPPKKEIEVIEGLRTRGTGGCGLSPYAAGAPLSAMIFLSALALAAIRRK